MYITPEIKSFKGLHLQKNSFEVPDGSLEQADNCVIYSDDVITKCRGFYKYSDPVPYPPADSQPPTGLTNFDGALIESTTSGLYWFDDDSNPPSSMGTATVIPTDDYFYGDTWVPIPYDTSQLPQTRFAQSNGNLYTTTDNGILKLTDVDSFLVQAGAPQGLDLDVNYTPGFTTSLLQPIYIPASAGPPALPAITTTFNVSYRVVFGYEDANKNLILGAPSSPVTINNPAVENVDCNVPGGPPYIVTVTSNNHGLVTGLYMYFFNANDGAGTPVAVPNANGTYQITVTGVNTFTYETTNDSTAAKKVSYAYAAQPTLEFSIPSEVSENIPWFYQIYRSNIAITGPTLSDYRQIAQVQVPVPQPSPRVIVFYDSIVGFSGPELYTNQNSQEGEIQSNSRPPVSQDIQLFQGSMFYANCTARQNLQFSVTKPFKMIEGITTYNIWSYFNLKVGSFVRRYLAVPRVGNYTSTGTVDPAILTGADLVITYTNHGFQNYGVTTIFISNAYAPASGGVLQFGIYYLIYVDADNFKLSLTPGGAAVPKQKESSVSFEAVQFPEPTLTGATWGREANQVVVFYDNHGFSSGMTVYLSGSTGTIPIPDGFYDIVVSDPDSFSFTQALGDSIGLITINAEDYCFHVVQTDPPAEGIVQTAQSLNKAINRDTESLIYGQYLSITTDDLGDIYLESKGFGEPIELLASDSNIADSVFPVVETWSHSDVPVTAVLAVVTVTFTSHGLTTNQIIVVTDAKDSTGVAVPNANGVYKVTVTNANVFTYTAIAAVATVAFIDYSNVIGELISLNQLFPNALYISKRNEPEAVPLINFLRVGSEKQPIQRIHALSNALIILKPDGVFRLTGDNVANFNVTLLDGTVQIIANKSSAVLNNQVVLLSNQGVAMTTETSVRIISRVIDDVIQSILYSQYVDITTCGLSYEIDRLYLLSTITPNYAPPIGPGPIIPLPDVVYAYNVMTDSWTTWQWTFTQAAIGPDRIMYTIDAQTSAVLKERRLNQVTDYSGQNRWVGIDEVIEIDGLPTQYATLYSNSTGYYPKFGDIIVKNNIVNTIENIINLGVNKYFATFFNVVNFVGGRVDNPWVRTGGVVTVSAVDHRLDDGSYVIIYESTGSAPVVDGVYQISVPDPDTFTFGDGIGDSDGFLNYYEAEQIYESYKLTVKFSPYHGGLTNKNKQFCQFQAHFRSPDCTAVTMYFAGDTYPTSEAIEWEEVLEIEGWGLFPWGLVAWGQETTVDLTTGTQSASILRTYIPATAARGTFIQPIIENQIAGNRFSLQSIAYDVRAYGTRTAK